MPGAIRLGEWRKLQEPRRRCKGRSEARQDFCFAAASGDEGFDETIRVIFPIVWGTLRY